MELIRGWHNVRARHAGCVATIGNFDGVHLGHRAILDQLLGIAERTGLPSTLITFEPQPQEFFAGERAPPRLTTLREKITAFRDKPPDRVLVMRFDEDLASMSPGAFVDRLLVSSLGVRSLVVGEDFRFGHRGEGNFAMLRAMGEERGFDVIQRDTFLVGGNRVSSSRTRDALAQGDFNAVQSLLGRPYQIAGRVVHGDKRGRTIGFPTANINLHRRVTPVSGVYAVRVAGLGRASLPAMANVGKRPTVDGHKKLLEVHLFDFGENIYGRPVQIEFVAKLRDEVKFESLDALKSQLLRDQELARAQLQVADSALR